MSVCLCSVCRDLMAGLVYSQLQLVLSFVNWWLHLHVLCCSCTFLLVCVSFTVIIIIPSL